MHTRDHTVRAACLLAALAGSASLALAQDSVSDATNVGGDAISAYTTQTSRYVVDLTQFQSLWGSQLAVGPILKATRDSDVLFNTLALGSVGVSADQRLNVALGGSFPYSLWTTRGAGIAPENSAPGSVSVSTVSRQFGVGLTDLNADATNVVGALIGVQADNITRLYVRRTNAAHSRITAGTEDTGTLAFGSIDASGNVGLRADGFNGTGSNRISGENVGRVAIASRSAGMNGLFKSGATNVFFDAAASTLLINAGAISTNPPAALPASIAGAPTSLLLNFANDFAVNAGAGTSAHLDPAIDAHRGNPAFFTIPTLGGVGVVSTLARSVAGAGLNDSINLTAVDAAGAIVATRSATLPSPMPGFPTLNASGDAQFLQYLSQVGFRGPSGLVGVGTNVLTGLPVAAATATDPTAGEFIAVASFPGGAPTWTVAAFEGQQIKNGPAGAVVGTIGSGSPVAFSAPAIDLLGNVYFVAEFDPTVGAPANALFKAVNTVAGYNVELLLKEGDVFTGANSATPYTIEKLALGDADSIASAGFHGRQVLQQQIPGYSTSDPASPFAVGGILVNAQIAYNNLGTSESYEAVLFVSPFAPPAPTCAGDVNGDGQTNAADFTILAGAFGSAVPPGTSGDLNGDGIVNAADFVILAGDFGCSN
jgi:hypothetical protein